MKRMLALLLSLAMALSFSAPVFAGTTLEKINRTAHPAEYYDLGSPTPAGYVMGVEVADFDVHYYDLGSPTPAGYVMGVEVADFDAHYYDLGSPTPAGYVMGVEVADLR